MAWKLVTRFDAVRAVARPSWSRAGNRGRLRRESMLAKAWRRGADSLEDREGRLQGKSASAPIS
jgi:hypothetical protein